MQTKKKWNKYGTLTYVDNIIYTYIYNKKRLWYIIMFICVYSL
jgi:hypothetical protein